MARRLLLADDSITIQKVVELVLAEEDFEIKCVSNGEDALKLMDSFRPDIVLADIEMPKVNGYQLCDKIKHNPATAATPVILLAGAFEPIDADLSASAGADDSVIKPFESQELISKINAALTISALQGADAEALAEPAEEAFDIGEELGSAVSAEPLEAVAEAVAEEDLWAMEDISEASAEFAAEELSVEELPAEPVAMQTAEIEEPKPAAIEPEPFVAPISRPAAAAAAAQPVQMTAELNMPSRQEIMALIDSKVTQQVAAAMSNLDIKETLVAAITPMMKDSIEKILWEMAPELVEKVTREAVRGAFSSISSEIEKVLWETVPELAGSIIKKEIDQIKSSI